MTDIEFMKTCICDTPYPHVSGMNLMDRARLAYQNHEVQITFTKEGTTPFNDHESRWIVSAYRDGHMVSKVLNGLSHLQDMVLGMDLIAREQATYYALTKLAMECVMDLLAAEDREREENGKC